MNQPDVKTIYFSPTNTTRTVVENISFGLGQNNPVRINLSNVEERERFASTSECLAASTDFFVIGMPIYFGKIPKLLIEPFKKTNGNGKATIAVVVYGNRDFEIALQQLVSLLDQSNFRVIGAGAFIGEHSFSSQIPMALGRPDQQDLLIAADFGQQAYRNQGNLKGVKAEDVPGKRNILVRMMPEKTPKPTFQREKCKNCGLCVRSCPMGILDPETKLYKSKDAEKLCLGCMSCVKKCPQNAKSLYFSPFAKFVMHKLFFKDAIKHRKEPFVILK